MLKVKPNNVINVSSLILFRRHDSDVGNCDGLSDWISILIPVVESDRPKCFSVSNKATEFGLSPTLWARQKRLVNDSLAGRVDGIAVHDETGEFNITPSILIRSQ